MSNFYCVFFFLFFFLWSSFLYLIILASIQLSCMYFSYETHFVQKDSWSSRQVEILYIKCHFLVSCKYMFCQDHWYKELNCRNFCQNILNLYDIALAIWLFFFLVFNPFSTNVPLLYPLKTENHPVKTGGFLMFSGDIEVEYWLKMG